MRGNAQKWVLLDQFLGVFMRAVALWINFGGRLWEVGNFGSG
jgi:hypothetical protein